ncbi:hypothetical protein EVJ50_14255 [Synechococcus sp. RSCCF101]|uniref:hypothetical protein n=1 Tax=Synechococcus sp. RSCCF101 TaxID=2511069 RepID=UPI001247C204|nr:hypothetical protein [Synechococcus sp. RSCCF101]QEY33223.1 hypothetical protein EVJ50_14255 [Synechococcus sp. RSCCF101]
MDHPLITAAALLMVVAVITLVGWALQLMQSAIDRREFSLMLAGCMVCSAAVGLATVMLITFSHNTPLQQQLGLGRSVVDAQDVAGVSLDAISLPEWTADL